MPGLAFDTLACAAHRVPHAARCYCSDAPLLKRSPLCGIAVLLSIRSASLDHRHDCWNAITEASVRHIKTDTNNHEYMHDGILFYYWPLFYFIYLYTFYHFSIVCISSFFCLFSIAFPTLRLAISPFCFPYLVVYTSLLLSLFYISGSAISCLLTGHLLPLPLVINNQIKAYITTKINKGPLFLSRSVQNHFL